MSIQSPKSQRPSAPGETPASDNLSETVKGGTNPERHAGGNPESPRVPSGLKHSGGRHQGNTDAESAVPVGPKTPHQGGGPGLAKDKGDGSRTGGSVHQT